MYWLLFVIGFLVISKGLQDEQVYYTGQDCQADSICATTCVQARNRTTPLLTINEGIGCLAPGDTLIIQEGTYNELLIGNTSITSTILAFQPNTQLLVTGTSWDNPTTLKGATGERVVIQPAQNYPGGGGVITITNPQLRYVIFDNLILDANQTTTNGVRISDASYIRIQQSEVKNAQSDGILLVGGDVSSGACCHELIQVDAHHHDVDLPCDPTSKELRGHGGYVETPRTVIDGSRFHDNAHHGFQFWSSHAGVHPDDSIIQNSEAFNNSLCNTRGSGIVTGSSSRIGIYNNRVYNNTLGISVGSPDSKVYHNTVYNNNKPSNNHGIFVRKNDIEVKNNIIIDHRENAILDFGTRTEVSTNLCDVATFGCSIVVSDAAEVFANAQQADFSLIAGSLAIDAGVPLDEVPLDVVGIRRPQGVRYDIGAFEFVQIASDPPVPEQLQQETLTLVWDPPTVNTDGSPLQDLAVYRLYMAFEPIPDDKGNAVFIAEIPEGTVTATVDVMLPQVGSRIYFRVVAVDTSGNESELSNEVSKDFLPPVSVIIRFLPVIQ